MNEQKETWSGNWGFLLAAAGSAIGLGNLWKFPYITGINGGGAFVVVYLVCILLIGMPLMICELAIGRHTTQNPLGAMIMLSPKRSQFAEGLGIVLLLSGGLLTLFSCYGFGGILALTGLFVLRYGWKAFGFMIGVLIPLLIVIYYGVIGGWTFLYVYKSFVGELGVFSQQAASEVLKPIAEARPGSVFPLLCAQVCFMLAAAGILWFGVQKGIERWSKILMPGMFILLAVLIIRSLSLENSMLGVKFFLAPDFSHLTANGVLTALGHAFFTLSLAMGIMITYGSYMRKDQGIVKCSLQVIGLDTLASMMAGLAIFPAIFAMNGKPDSGPTLLFEVLPATFNQIPGNFGWLWNGIFFVILSIAALTSTMSLLECPISVLIKQFKMARHWAVACVFAFTTLFGMLCALSMANWDNLPRLGSWIETLFSVNQSSLFQTLDVFCSDWLLPIGGMLTAIFVGWIWNTHNALKEIRQGASINLDCNIFVLLAGLKKENRYQCEDQFLTPALLWGITVRFIAPLGVLLAFLHTIDIL